MQQRIKHLGQTLSLILLVACNPSQQSLDSSTRQTTNRSSTAAAQSSSDLSVDISIPSPWSNAKDIPVSWGEIQNASEYQLDIASDAECANVQQSLRTKSNSTHITDLAEGTWFLCLKWKIEPKLHESNSNALQIIIDRQAPLITGEGIQSVAAGESPIVTVTDGETVQCSWSSSNGKLTITDSETMTPKFATPTAGTYFVQLSCVDMASNSSQQSFSLTLPATAVATPPTTPTPKDPTTPPTTPPPPAVPPTVNAGPDISKNQAAALAGTATGAQSYLWTQVSGPGVLTFTAATSLQSNVTASMDGAYVIRLTATAAGGLTAQDELTLTWDTTAPTVNAGQDVVIGVATTLQGIVGADAVSYNWRKVSGTGTITFSSTTTLTPLVSASVDSTYVLELSATDAVGNTRTDQMQFQWLTSVPTVNVGPDLSVKTTASVAPTVSGATTFAWSKVSGPGTITFSAATAKNTNITASTDGSYVIRLTVTNAGGQTANDTLTLVWDTIVPTVSAGADRTANQSVTQTGTSTGGSTYAWTKVSGPGTVTFGSATALVTTLATSADGAYTLRLTATDAAGNSASDDMILSWDATGPNNVTALTATPGTKSMALAWTDGGGGTQSYLVLRSTATISDTPARGTVYTAGNTLGASSIVSVGNTASFADSNLTGGTTYFYKVFSYDSLGNYNTGVQISGVADYLKTLKTTLTRLGFYSANPVWTFHVNGSMAYICSDEAKGLNAVDVTNKALPVSKSTNNLNNTADAGICSDVKAVGNYAYVADWDRGLVTVDVSNPAAPAVKGALDLGYYASFLIVSGNYAYIAVEDEDTGGGLAIVNISNPAAPMLTSYTDTGGNAAGVAKIGNFIYLTHRDSGTFIGVKVINVSNPAAPTVGQTLTRSNGEGVEVNGSYVYVTEGEAGLEIFDAANPASLVSKSVTVLPDAGYIQSVSVSGNYAFLPSYDTPKMYVYDITNKTSLSLSKTYTTYSNLLPNFVQVVGAHAYLSTSNANGSTSGLEIIDVFTLQ